ncbi:MAG: response regulator transcription factor [Actinomycetales bacterium]|nr:response regulator transcription factor [Actinomycetales bacterium]
MSGIVICHGMAAVRERLAAAAAGVPSLSSVRTAGDATELLRLARIAPPGIVLLDAHLPAPGPIETLRQLRQVSQRTVVVVLAEKGDEVALDRAITLGARGYLTPEASASDLAAVAAHIFAAPLVPNPVTPVPPVAVSPGTRYGASIVGAESTREVELTKREHEVLVGMSNGRSNSQIGQDLFLSEDTIKTHAQRLFRKLGARDRAQAVAIGIRSGLIH